MRFIQAFFVGMLVLPTAFQIQRGLALAVLVGLAFLIALGRWRLHREILFLWLATMILGAFGVAWGIFNDAPGAVRVTTVYLIWPALYLLFIGLVHSLSAIRQLESALLLGICLATTMALTVLGAGLIGLGDVVLPLFAFQDAGFGTYQGFTEFRLNNLTTVMYGFPFVATVLLARRRELTRWQRLWLSLLLALMVLVALGSGRRMFWLLVLLTPVLALFFLQLSTLRVRFVGALGMLARMGVLAALAAVGLIVAFELQPLVLMQKFVGAFLGEEFSSGIRYEQAEALWGAFEASPLFGIGLGSTVDSGYREGWAFELWYLSLLKSVGILGFLVYTVAVVWVIVRGTALARRDQAFAALFVPLVAGLAGFLIMTATNPYLGKFDYLWVIFLPVALINAYLTRKSDNA